MDVAKRNAFYEQIPHFWDRLYGEEYALYDISLLEKEEVDHIRIVTNRVGHIFFKTARLLREVPEQTLLDMGYPQETIPYLRLHTMTAESVIARLDLLPTSTGYKCIEINSDTPTFIKELFAVNGQVAAHFSVGDPNMGMEEQLKQVVQQAIGESINGKQEAHIVFTAHQDNIEDRETVLYLQQLANFPSRFVPLHQLVIEKNVGLFDEQGRRIDVLYRQTFPIEHLIRDVDAEGNPIGIWLLDLVVAGKLTLINPPSAFLLQNKAVQAVIWGLHEERHEFFTTEEHEWIEDYFLPTYLEAEPFLTSEVPFVKKPCFGREGDTVEIYQEDGTLDFRDPNQSYQEYVSIYQQFVEAKKTSFVSEKGYQEGHLLVGSFLLSGEAAALGYRIGGKITNNLSYYLPIGVRR